MDLFDDQYQGNSGSFVSFTSESGALEFFVTATAKSSADSKGFGTGLNHVQKAQKNIADISGYIPLPPRHALGFHFSAWEYTSAYKMIERNELFTKHEFPVDFFWLDIDWANRKEPDRTYEYFNFNPKEFSEW